jgi:serine/threonine-protein kinase
MLSPENRLLALRDKLAGMVLRGSNNVQFHLRDRIGEGGQGWVFTANWDEPGGFVVIVKVLRPDAVSNDALRRFQREAEVLRKLATHGAPNPHIVRFFDHAIAKMPSPVDGEPLVLPFTVLEYVNGPTLEQVLDTTRGRGLPVERVRRILRQVSQALELVHAQKVVHRDLKPSNILLATDAGAEVAKVTDFGLVKLVEMANMARTVTLAGASLGYAPPEQYEQGNERVTTRTDVFSLAAITYELLSGKFAFPFRDGENPLLIVTRIMNGPRPQLAKTTDSLAPDLAQRAGLIERLDRELTRGLAADPNDRHPSISEFWGAIEPILKSAIEASGMQPIPQSAEQALPFLETISAMTPQKADLGSSVRNSSVNPPKSSEVRVRGSDPQPSLPTSWIWRISTRPIGTNVVRAAAFAPDGSSAIGIGPGGLARWDRGNWVAIALPTAVDARLVRGIRRLRGGDIVLVGDHATAVRIAPSGKHDAWTVPDREMSIHGAFVDERAGVATFVGDRASRPSINRPGVASSPTVGNIIQLTDGRVSFAADVVGSQRLRAVTRMLGGAMVACGDWGAIARVEGGAAELVGNICSGHLLAIEPLVDGGAVTVGAGGHALHLTARLDAQLEAVQTTRDLCSIAVSDDGAVWAGAAQARILRRSPEGWTRMSGEFGIASSVLAIWASARLVRAVCDDGAVIEGQAS